MAAQLKGLKTSQVRRENSDILAAMPGPQAPRERAANSAGRAAIERRLVEDHIPFVRSLARKLRDHVPMVEFDDLVGFGMRGLIRRHSASMTAMASRSRPSPTTGCVARCSMGCARWAGCRVVNTRACAWKSERAATRRTWRPAPKTPPRPGKRGVEQQIADLGRYRASPPSSSPCWRADDEQLSDDRAAPRMSSLNGISWPSGCAKPSASCRQGASPAGPVLLPRSDLEQAGAAMGLSSHGPRACTPGQCPAARILDAEGVSELAPRVCAAVTERASPGDRAYQQVDATEDGVADGTSPGEVSTAPPG